MIFDIKVLTTDEDKAILKQIPDLDQSFEFFNYLYVDCRSYIVAFDHGVIVGLVAFVETSFRHPNALGVAYVSTHREHRARGVATTLVDALFQYAEKIGRHISNTSYEPDGILWLKPSMTRTALRYPHISLFERI